MKFKILNTDDFPIKTYFKSDFPCYKHDMSLIAKYYLNALNIKTVPDNLIYFYRKLRDCVNYEIDNNIVSTQERIYILDSRFNPVFATYDKNQEFLKKIFKAFDKNYFARSQEIEEYFSNVHILNQLKFKSNISKKANDKLETLTQNHFISIVDNNISEFINMATFEVIFILQTFYEHNYIDLPLLADLYFS